MKHVIKWSMWSYGSLRWTFQFLFPISIKWCYAELEYLSSASRKWHYRLECLSSVTVYHRPIIYNQNEEPNPTGNVLLKLNSKIRLVVLALCVLLSSKKSLEMEYMGRMEKNMELNPSTGSLIGIFKPREGARKK